MSCWRSSAATASPRRSATSRATSPPSPTRCAVRPRATPASPSMTSHSDAVVLIGPMGAGKTSIGKKAARALGVPFFDTDAAVVRDHGPIDKLFVEHGEAQFRAAERAAVREGLATA